MTSTIGELLTLSQVNPQWQPLLASALQAIDESYITELLNDDRWLPGKTRLFSAFQRDRENCRYLLFGESPYPRAESANGIAFYDAAVGEIWSESGLSKPVNRATSLRNIIKTALVAQGYIKPLADGSIPQSLLASVDKKHCVKTLAEVFTGFYEAGFLMMNATPVLHPERKPQIESRYWLGFIEKLLIELANSPEHNKPALVLWGKVANQIQRIPISAEYSQRVAEHPYNLSFIHNPEVLKLFAKLKLLQKKPDNKI